MSGGVHGAPPRLRSLALLLAGAAALAGCAQTRPQLAAVAACPLEMKDISVDPLADDAPSPATVAGTEISPVPGTESSSVSRPRQPGDFGYSVEQTLRAKPSTTRAQTESARYTARGLPPPSFSVQQLVLSGGGKWGSFGAGFLHEDAARRGLPDYRIVTGVSTGALQAPFVFVGNRPVSSASTATRYSAKTDTLILAGEPVPGGAPRQRTYLDDLPLAYRISRSETVVDVYIKRPSKLGIGDGLTIVRRGTGSDLRGLRTRLETLIDDDMMLAIAEEAGRTGIPGDRRELYVGLVDMDDSKPYAVNMTRLATDWQAAAPQSALRNRLKTCFHDVLIASSSEPLVAKPVFIQQIRPAETVGSSVNNRAVHMYMDGGMRHGVFLAEVSGAAERVRKGAGAQKVETTVIINGQLQSTPKKQEADPKEKTEPDTKWFEAWDILKLLRRAQEIFTDQVYQMSTERVIEHADALGDARVMTARGYREHMYKPQPGDPTQGGEQSCAAWQDQEKDEGFPPMFMRCLTSYGRAQATARAGAPAWNWQTKPAP